MPKFSPIRLLIAIAIAALLTYALISQIHPKEILDAFERLSWRWLLLAAVILLCMNALKAVRFSRLQNASFRAVDLLPVVFVHNLFIIFMPSRTGELSY